MLLDILKYSNRDDFDFHILLPYGEGTLDNRARDLGINLHFLDSGKSHGKIKLYQEGVARIKNLKPDLIHTHTRFSDLLGLYGGKQAGIKTRMMTVHAAGLYFLDSKPLYEGIIEYGVVRFAKHFAVISKAVGEYLQSYGNVNPDLITLIYNGIDPERVCPSIIKDRNQVRDELGIDKDEFVIFSMGRLIPEKGFDILLDEFKTFHDRCGKGFLIIVGYGTQKDALKKKADELGISQKVLFTGRIENPGEIMVSADCFVLASRKEGFGITILEAMANGLPVIASNTGGIPEIIHHQKNGLIFDIGQKNSLTTSLEKLFDDPALSQNLSKEGKKTALEKFHVKHTSKAYEDLYFKLLS